MTEDVLGIWNNEDARGLFQAAFEQAPTGIIIVNNERRIHYANDAYCELTGYSLKELRELPISRLTHPEDWPHSAFLVRRLAEGNARTFVVEKRYVRKDGREVWVQNTASVISENGAQVGILVLAEDITAQKLMESAHTALFCALFKAAHDAIVVADNERRYVDANAAASKLFGLELRELRGRTVDDFIEEIPSSSGVADLWQGFQVEGVQRGECRLRRPDGKLREVEYNAKANFVPGLHLSILRDVTEYNEHKRTEEMLKSLAQHLELRSRERIESV